MAKARPAWTLALLCLLALLLWLAWLWASDSTPVLNLSTLQQQQAELLDWHAKSPWAVRAGFFALYLVCAALALPGIAVLTLAGGALLGFGWGLVLVSFASSLGATLSFLLARYVLRDLVHARMGPRVMAMQARLAREGAMYLLSLRLIPLVPFGLLNLAMGLTNMPARTFYVVSQVGMLASTVLFVQAGTQLAAIQSSADVLTPRVGAALAALGAVFALLPWASGRVLQWWRRRRVLAPWRSHRPRHFDRNLVVIGAGAGGLVSAYIAAAAQAKVTLVEARTLGGDCLNLGCVPSKALIQSAQMAHQVRNAAQFGVLSTPPQIDFIAVMRRVNEVIARIAPHDSVQRYTDLGVQVLKGYATLVNPWTVEVRGADGALQRITTRSVVIAAGAQPIVPDLPGLQDVGFATSDTLWEQLAQCSTLPRRIVVLGGGPVGCELAQAFARLGAAVTLVESAPQVLEREDDAVCALVQQALTADGVVVKTAHRALRCAWEGADPAREKTVLLEHAGQQHTLAFDLLVCAVGRKARLSGYGLEALGLAVDQTVQTNNYLQTVFPNIYAAGDVAGPYQFTHTAAHQAWYATVNALFGDIRRTRVDYRAIPSATFVEPQVARVGLNEKQALRQGVAYETSRYDLADLDRALCNGGAGAAPPTGFVQVLTVPGKDRILGVTIVAPQGAELLAEWVLAMGQGLGVSAILGAVHSYPTLSEANKYAAGVWRRQHTPAALLRWARRFHSWRRG
jgi:pyruvate/2-oxoglutarate dehydrogenase complex dihydrolipoamide dehydrogenase (E3) component/uncharacterized membrane protein YdjX (TVP38/TMEM64 family)